jgi:hypothetical protein
MPYRYQITVSHEALGKVRILSGADQYVLQSRARELKARWDEQYQKKVNAADRVQHLENSQQEARERSEAAVAERRSLETLLVNAVSDRAPFDWNSLKDETRFSTKPPLPPVLKLKPLKPSVKQAKISLLDRLLPGKVLKKEKEAAEETALQQERWRSEVEELEANNQKIERNFLSEQQALGSGSIRSRRRT